TLAFAEPGPGAKIVRSPLALPYASLKYFDLVSIDPLERLLAITSELLDDELQLTSGRPSPAPDHRDTTAAGALPPGWRLRWSEADAECARLREEVAMLSRRHPLRSMMATLWWKALEHYRVWRERRAAQSPRRIPRG